MKTIGILADELADTRLGVAYYEKKGLKTVSRPIVSVSGTFDTFAVRSPEEKHAYVVSLVEALKTEGAEAICVNANTICGHVDFQKIAEETGMRIATPMQAYGRICETHRHPLILAVTAAAISSIQAAVSAAVPDANVLGVYDIDLAHNVEAGMAPMEIVEARGLQHLCDYAKACGCSAIILGCTHLPYLAKEFQECTELPVIDPADIVAEMLGVYCE
ncbi:MAG: aspartate/glutamate racemase family protein [Firmicutes bacterium]|nr:aspartate/glutamate racemase family protein [Bacillota bacterium]